MSKFTESFKKYWMKYLIAFFISFLVGATIFLLLFFLSKNKMTLVGALNSSAISFVILFSFAILAFVGSTGMFDSLSYGFSQLGHSMFGKKANQLHDFNEYKQNKNAKRMVTPRFWVAMLFSSIPFGVAIIVLEIVKNV